ncbi:MAG TPA: hypothetical protein VFC84_02300 [Desulfosporosinus sp.]|nr:hypothetical protein [Desulfosporosinus sp.]
MKTNRNPQNRKIVKRLVVFPNCVTLPSDNCKIIKKVNKRGIRKKIHPSQERHEYTFPRQYLIDLNSIGRFVKKHQSNFDVLEVMYENKLTKLCNVILTPDVIMDSLNSYIGKDVYVLGYINDYEEHGRQGHLSLRFASRNFKLFIHANNYNSNPFKHFIKKLILSYGKVFRVEGRISPQIDIKSLKDIIIIE